MTGDRFPTGSAALQGGRYVARAEVKTRGMSRMREALDTHLNRVVLIKHPSRDSALSDADRAEAVQSFACEMRTLASLHHPAIPALFDSFLEGGHQFFVQELITGEDLQKKCDATGGKGLPERQVLHWISQVLSVLAYLESLDPQVIHRDIKPANIVVDAQNRVMVVDFSIVLLRAHTGVPARSTAMGTPGYAPREQFEGKETTLSDIYALGATMHQLLTGRNPQGVEPLFHYPPIKALNKQVSKPTIDMVEKALRNDPARRYQSASEMKVELDRVLLASGWKDAWIARFAKK
jgi:serine/threonine protein kinase